MSSECNFVCKHQIDHQPANFSFGFGFLNPYNIGFWNQYLPLSWNSNLGKSYFPNQTFVSIFNAHIGFAFFILFLNTRKAEREVGLTQFPFFFGSFLSPILKLFIFYDVLVFNHQFYSATLFESMIIERLENRKLQFRWNIYMFLKICLIF